MPGTLVSRRHLNFLDGLRGMAVLMVFFSHFLHFDLPPDSLPCKICGFCGGGGVDLFFVISGFLIGGIIIDNYTSPNFLSVFFLRRACRIVPLYYAFLLFNIWWELRLKPFPTMAPHVAPPFSLWWYFTGLQNWLMGLDKYWSLDKFTHTWSLAIEDQFYFVAPAVVLLLPLRKVRTLAVGLILVVLATRIGVQLWDNSEGFRLHILTPFRIDTILFGILCAFAIRSRYFDLIKKWQFALLLAWIALAAGVALVIYRGKHSDGYTYGPSVVAAFYGISILLLYLNSEGLCARILSIHILRRFGRYSYFIYLFSGILSEIVFFGVFHRQMKLVTAYDLLPLLILLGLCYAAGAVSWYGYEKWMLAIGHRKKYKPATRADIRPLKSSDTVAA